jgi:hypothetical protein
MQTYVTFTAVVLRNLDGKILLSCADPWRHRSNSTTPSFPRLFFHDASPWNLHTIVHPLQVLGRHRPHSPSPKGRPEAKRSPVTKDPPGRNSPQSTHTKAEPTGTPAGLPDMAQKTVGSLQKERHLMPPPPRDELAHPLRLGNP